MDKKIQNFKIDAPDGTTYDTSYYYNQTNKTLKDFIDDINSQGGSVIVIIPEKYGWYFDFQDITKDLSLRMIEQIYSNPFSGDVMKQYAKKIKAQEE